MLQKHSWWETVSAERSLNLNLPALSQMYYHFIYVYVIPDFKELGEVNLQNQIIGKYIKMDDRASLVVQWLGILLPTQGTWVWTLVREDPTYHQATKPVGHNYWACALEPVSHNYWAWVPQLLKPTRLEPVLHNKRSHRNEKPVHWNEK